MVLSIFLSFSVKADNSISLEEGTKPLLIGHNLHYWVDRSGILDFDNARQKWSTGAFEKGNSEVINLGVDLSTSYWFHANLTYSPSQGPQPSWKLIFDHDTADAVSLFLVGKNGAVKKTSVDTSRPFYNRENTALVPVLNIPLNEAGDYDIFIHVEASGPAIFPFMISKESDLIRSTSIEYAFLCVYYGALLAMIFFNLFVYIGTKSKAYLYYVIYVTNVGVFLGFVKGLGLAFLIPNMGELNRFFINASGMLMFVATVTFIRAFLCTRERTPSLDKFLFWLPIAVLAFIPFAGTKAGAICLVIVSPVTIIFILTASIKVLRQGHSAAKLFLLGWSSLIVAICYQAFAYIGILPWSVFTGYAIHIGSLVEVVLIALALAEKINTYKLEKDNAELESKQRLIEKNEALNETDRLKNEFIATISHELRTPLNGIVGSIEIAKITPSECGGHLDNALMSSRNLKDIIDDILLLSEILSGETVVIRKQFSMSEIIDQVIKDGKIVASTKNIIIRVNLENIPKYKVIGDPYKIAKSLGHILSNAIKFSTEGSPVHLDIRVDELTVGNLRLHINIKDDGIGIDANKLGALFEAFNQADNSYRRSYGGLGIGLTLAHGIATLMGGSIDIDSEKGVGTSVKLEFLLEKPQASNGDSQATDNRFLSRVDSVLVVEDNIVNQHVLVSILKKSIGNVDSVYNGENAVEKCIDTKYDLIFMDCQMPVMDGFEATRKIRSIDNINSETPIIAVTANATEIDRKHCHDVGMNDFVKKPISRDIIENIINEYRLS
ncbi:hypothetical protein A9Q99_00505 [Gammaproteobacteria bacterium 45_16_T64]|nr:hypothetical protein A9Q99_00505 [Gammaproteobacteria bacterium 45_16_T64]